MASLDQLDAESALRTLNRYGEIEEEAFMELAAYAQPLDVSKGQLLVHQGDLSEDMYLVVRGAVRAFSVYGEKEFTDWFALPDQFFCAITSYFTGQVSHHTYEVIVPGRLLKLQKSEVDKLLEKYRGFERIVREVVTETMLFSCSQLISTRYMTAEERYHEITTQYPSLLQIVPLKHLASYLCVSPETLSRIRAKSLVS